MNIKKNLDAFSHIQNWYQYQQTMIHFAIGKDNELCLG